ncbi:hypothetical protein QMM42_08250 [Leptospira santarosai]|uniref:hypothetical protein n=1 Tax=Leptospira santarosai TaxID=28183 RepID=UPI0024AFA6EF|nr:hypothetical protein [Leptospira santarosai]MDI7186195.1 hypothetical protein [Leptospira santarosai]MDI7188640.1 hypothetical protein [Leptospira santarosai]MDI7199851.1 hypothetical protein [Leptospira santarosai]MDI7210207.1 hypothetical protein [Leptospira santarosai]MDI7213254.1 hypothetical protein [Leptospira santarosai]
MWEFPHSRRTWFSYAELTLDLITSYGGQGDLLENYRFFLRIFGDSILMNPGFSYLNPEDPIFSWN